MAQPSTVDLNELLAHERWATRLARALVRDDDDADDVVQEARVSFWRRGPTQPGRARSWMGTVVRNLVRSRVRGARRRQATQAASGDLDAAPSAEDLAERLELHRLLATLVGELKEPFREAVLLRYYEGLSSAEIARRLGIPAGTVRWRLKAGLDELRSHLDDRHGNRKAWVALLAGRLADPTDASKPPATGTVGAWLGAGALTAAAGTIALIAFAARPQQREPPTRAPQAIAATRAGAAAAAPPRLRTSHSMVSADTATLPDWARAPGYPSRVIAGRVLADGRPVAAAELRLSAGMLTHARELDRHARSGPDGRFTFPPQDATNWFLTVFAAGRAPQILYVDLRATEPRVPPAGQAPDQLTIELGPCQVFTRGVVRDGAGGLLAGARIKLTRMWNNGGVQTTADSAGRYELCVPGGAKDLTLVAEADGHATVETLAYLTESREIDFTLEPEAVVSGRAVLDDGSTTLPAVRVTLGPVGTANPNNPPLVGVQPVRLETVTDHRGEFHLGGLAAGRYRLQAIGDGVLPMIVDHQVDLAPGQRLAEVVVQMSLASLVEGTVRRNGVPTADVMLAFEVRGTPTVPENHSVLYPWARSGPGGRYQVQLRRGAIVERILGAWPRKQAPPGFTVTAGRMSTVDIDLP